MHSFPPHRWAGLPDKTTNNGAEAFHRHFGDLFGYLKAKPGIWHFLRNLQRFNRLKSIKMRSQKSVKVTTDFWSEAIKNFHDNDITITRLLDILSRKKQPKIRALNVKRRK